MNRHKSRAKGEIHRSGGSKGADKLVAKRISRKLTSWQKSRPHHSAGSKEEYLHHISDPDTDKAPDNNTSDKICRLCKFSRSHFYGDKLARGCKECEFNEAHNIRVACREGLEYLARLGYNKNRGKQYEYGDNEYKHCGAVGFLAKHNFSP